MKSGMQAGDKWFEKINYEKLTCSLGYRMSLLGMKFLHITTHTTLFRHKIKVVYGGNPVLTKPPLRISSKSL